MLLIYFNDFLMDHDQASVDTSNLTNELRLSDGTCLSSPVARWQGDNYIQAIMEMEAMARLMTALPM